MQCFRLVKTPNVGESLFFGLHLNPIKMYVPSKLAPSSEVQISGYVTEAKSMFFLIQR